MVENFLEGVNAWVFGSRYHRVVRVGLAWQQGARGVVGGERCCGEGSGSGHEACCSSGGGFVGQGWPQTPSGLPYCPRVRGVVVGRVLFSVGQHRAQVGGAGAEAVSQGQAGASLLPAPMVGKFPS